MRNQLLPLFLLLIFTTSLEAQFGGRHAYEFLRLPLSARITGLGEKMITIKDSDVNFAFANPAVLNDQMHNAISFNHSFHLGGIGHGFLGYARKIESWNTMVQGGIQYVSYGDFDQTDEFGEIIGSFNANEYAIQFGASHQLYDRLSLGANLKIITSQLESYNSFGLAVDLGAHYQDTSGRFSAALVLKNVGAQLSTFAGERESLPFEIQLGISQRLKHLPFRISIIGHHLERGNLLYDNPESEENSLFTIDNQNNGDNAFSDFVDNFFRHIIFSGEFLFGKQENFRVGVAYNHFRRQDLSVRNFRSLAGFSMGVGLKIKRFRIDYGHGFYHLAGGSNHLSISTNLNQFIKREM